MNGWLIYWITRLDALQAGFIVTLVVGTILSIVMSIAFFSEGWEPGKMWLKRFVSIAITAGLLLVFLPSTKEAVAIYLIPKIANNEQVQKVPEQALRMLNAKLEQWIDDQTETNAEVDE